MLEIFFVKKFYGLFKEGGTFKGAGGSDYSGR
jgi:hypothetical protein